MLSSIVEYNFNLNERTFAYSTGDECKKFCLHNFKLFLDLWIHIFTQVYTFAIYITKKPNISYDTFCVVHKDRLFTVFIH